MQGFRLTEDVKREGFSGATIKAAESGELFNIGAALRQEDEEGVVNHNGVIYTDDDMLAEILASHPALERVAAEAIPGDAKPVKSPTSYARDVSSGAGGALPYQVQTNDVVPGVSREQLAAIQEVPAEHLDEPSSVEDAIAAGEAVKGQRAQESPQAAGSSSARESNPQQGEATTTSKAGK